MNRADKIKWFNENRKLTTLIAEYGPVELMADQAELIGLRWVNPEGRRIGIAVNIAQYPEETRPRVLSYLVEMLAEHMEGTPVKAQHRA